MECFTHERWEKNWFLLNLFQCQFIVRWSLEKENTPIKSKTPGEGVRGNIYSSYAVREALVEVVFCSATPWVKLMVVCQWLLRTWHAEHEAFIYVSNASTSGKIIHWVYVGIYFPPPLHTPVNWTRGRTLSPNTDENQLQHSTHWNKLFFLECPSQEILKEPSVFHTVQCALGWSCLSRDSITPVVVPSNLCHSVILCFIHYLPSHSLLKNFQSVT